MKLFNSFGMNPRTVRMFCLEKDITIDKVEVDILGAENRQPEFLAKNPAGQLPALELDNGTIISESYAICEYLEELLPNTPSLIGHNAEDRAVTRMWWRRVELNICVPAVHGFYYAEAFDLFNTRVPCDPASADFQKKRAQHGMEWLEGLLGEGTYLCGDRFSVADICLYCYVDQLRTVGQPIDPSLTKVNAWFNAVNERPSAEASVFPVQPMGMRG